MSLESKHFIASLTDVEAITKAVLEAQSTASDNRGLYHKILVAKTQAILGIPPRQRNAPAPERLSSVQKAQQLEALKTAHAFYYQIVFSTAKAILGPGKLLNRKTGFARTSCTTVRKWIAAGYDIGALAAAKVTKSSITIPAEKRKIASPKVLTNRVRKYGDRFLINVAQLGESDAAVARETLEAVKAAIQETLDKISSRRKVATASHTQRGLRAAA